MEQSRHVVILDSELKDVADISLEFLDKLIQ